MSITAATVQIRWEWQSLANTGPTTGNVHNGHQMPKTPSFSQLRACASAWSDQTVPQAAQEKPVPRHCTDSCSHTGTGLHMVFTRHGHGHRHSGMDAWDTLMNWLHQTVEQTRKLILSTKYPVLMGCFNGTADSDNHKGLHHFFCKALRLGTAKKTSHRFTKGTTTGLKAGNLRFCRKNKLKLMFLLAFCFFCTLN